MEEPLESKKNGDDNDIYVYSNYYQYRHIQAGSQLEVPCRLTPIIDHLRKNYSKFVEIKDYKSYYQLMQCLPQIDQDQITKMLNELSSKQLTQCKYCSVTNDVPLNHDVKYRKSETFEMSDEEIKPKESIVCTLCQSDITKVNDRYSYLHIENNDTTFNWDTHLVLKNVLCTIYAALKGEENKIARDLILLIRPPGHHCSANIISGFCYLNWAHLISITLNQKVCILDLDLHHGNGTEIMAKNHANLLFISLHYYDGIFFPKTGNEKEFVAENVINVNMKKGSNDKNYLVAIKHLFQRIKDFKTDIFVISMGCDIIIGDNFNIMQCSNNFYRSVYDLLKSEFGKRILFLLEGGYKPDNITETIKAILK